MKLCKDKKKSSSIEIWEADEKWTKVGWGSRGKDCRQMLKAFILIFKVVKVEI